MGTERKRGRLEGAGGRRQGTINYRQAWGWGQREQEGGQSGGRRWEENERTIFAITVTGIRGEKELK